MERAREAGYIDPEQVTDPGMRILIEEMNVRLQLEQITRETPVEVVAELAWSLDKRVQREEAISAAKRAELSKHSEEIVAAQLEQGWDQSNVDMRGYIPEVLAEAFGFDHLAHPSMDPLRDFAKLSLHTRLVSGRWQHHSVDTDKHGEEVLVFYDADPGVVPTVERVARDRRAVIQDGGGVTKVVLRATDS